MLWTCANLITILDKAHNRPVNFEFNRTQRWAYWNILDQQSRGEAVRGWWLKGRQFGWSTLVITMMFLRTVFLQMNSLILAHMEKPGQSIFRKADLALKSMPTFEMRDGDKTQVIRLIDPTTSNSAGNLMAWLGKDFNALLRRDSAENRDAGVGETWQNVHLSEVPLYPDAAHTIGVLAPAMSTLAGSMTIGEFTARNEGDFAHKRWLSSIAGVSGYRAVFGAWYWHEAYVIPAKATDRPFTPEELAYRDAVRVKGHEYPLGDDGFLIPRLHAKWLAGEDIAMHDIAVGFELSDEQLLFRRHMIGEFNGDYSKWRSEFPYCPEEAFAVAGRKLIDPSVMDVMDGDAREPLSGQPGRGEYRSHQSAGGKGRARWIPSTAQGRVWRWELPQPGSTYVVDCDPSSGAGVDPSAIHVLKVSHQRVRVVASFEGFERPYEQARLLARIGRHYRDESVLDLVTKKIVKGSGRPAEIVVERNGFGDAVIQELLHVLKYRRIWRFTSKDKDNYKGGHAYGFPTYKDTKMPMLNQLAQGCFDRQLVVPCRRTLASLRALQYLDDEDRTAGAPRGQHDDLAMAIGIGFHAATQKAAFRFRPVGEDLPEWLKDPMFERAG